MKQSDNPAAGRPSRRIHVEPRAPRVDSEKRAREIEARKRVAALVSGGLHFKIKRHDGQIHGQRGTGSTKLAARLASKNFSSEVTLDLRAQPAVDVGAAIASFVRAHHRRGVRQLSIVFSPLPNENPEEAAIELVVAALITSAAAPLVRAFSSVHPSLGGNTTLAVLLI
ncbi:MAG TPA: hypothetical protein VJV78_40595 [Polyangiales bacterium]|nr:hypothetical protein [Polyangiales bacterium]